MGFGSEMESPLKKEFQYYLDHQGELARRYEGKVIVLKGEVVIGVFDDEVQAVTETQNEHELGTFLVQKVSSDPASSSQTFHSRVVFS